jgi:hypothetical protein
VPVRPCAVAVQHTFPQTLEGTVGTHVESPKAAQAAHNPRDVAILLASYTRIEEHRLPFYCPNARMFGHMHRHMHMQTAMSKQKKETALTACQPVVVPVVLQVNFNAAANLLDVDAYTTSINQALRGTLEELMRLSRA